MPAATITRKVLGVCLERSGDSYVLTDTKVNINVPEDISFDDLSSLISKDQQHIVKNHSILIWVPNQPIPNSQTVSVDVAKMLGVRPLEQIACLANVDDSIQSLFEVQTRSSKLQPPSVIHILIELAPWTTTVTAGTQRAEEHDDIAALTNKFHLSLKFAASSQSPSTNAKSKGYYAYQKDEFPLLDGRYPPGRQATIAPPIELFHTIFAEFRAKLATADDDIPVSIVRTAAEFMRSATVIARSEKERKESTRTLLSNVLGNAFSQIVNHDRTSPDHIFEVSLANFAEAVALVLVEEKFELGEGGSEPSVQGSFSYVKYWTGVGHDQVLHTCCCPTFIIALGGPWLSILGAVYTTQPIVQRLTPYLWLGNSRANDDEQVLANARVFYALAHSLNALWDWYKLVKPIESTPGPSFPPTHPMTDPHRFFPSITSYTVGDNTIEFTYICTLEANETACVTFLAQLKDATRVVVKFTPSYGEAAHRALFALNKAPELLHCAPLSTADRRLDYGKLKMVIMEYVEGKTLGAWGRKLPEDVINAVKAAVRALHDEDFVHGDLRGPNIMIADGAAEGDRVKFIDFDWAGKAGEVRYPMHLSPYIRRHAGVSDYDYITKEHDAKMLAQLLF